MFLQWGGHTGVRNTRNSSRMFFCKIYEALSIALSIGEVSLVPETSLLLISSSWLWSWPCWSQRQLVKRNNRPKLTLILHFFSRQRWDPKLFLLFWAVRRLSPSISTGQPFLLLYWILNLFIYLLLLNNIYFCDLTVLLCIF